MKHMKKYLGAILVALIFILLPATALAGDIPEALLSMDSALLFFGEVKIVNETEITLIQKKNVKGEFTENAEITFPEDFVFTLEPVPGNVYLCGYLDENNPLYLWETDSQEPATLKIVNQDEMSQRLEKYLNDGTAAEAEAKRLAAASVSSETVPDATATSGNNASQAQSSVAVIGGADGPTSVFVAGSVGSGVSGAFPVIIASVGLFLLLIVAIVAVVIIGKVLKK